MQIIFIIKSYLLLNCEFSRKIFENIIESAILWVFYTLNIHSLFILTFIYY